MYNLKTIRAIFLVSLILAVSCNTIRNPKEISDNHIDYVPNSETAIKIAEAVWHPIYGDKINDSKPYTAVLENNVWIVDGTLPEGMKGGTPHIEIQKKDGKILGVSHGK